MADTIAAIHFVTEAPSAGQTVTQVYADNLPSGGGASYTLPAATANALGGVKLQVFGDAIGNAKTDVAAAAAAPTKAEYDALKDAYNGLASQFNRLVSGLASSGVIQVPSGK